MTALMIFELASVVLWDTECSTHLSVACFWKAKACCFALDVCSVSFTFSPNFSWDNPFSYPGCFRDS